MRILWHSLFVILGGCSYGILAPFVKYGFQFGMTSSDAIRMQFLFGFPLIMLVNLLFVRYKMSLLTVLKLLASGIPMALTTTFYYNSLDYLNASIAIVLLFQYTWMGLVVEMITERRRPEKSTVIAAILLFFGSLLAVNIYQLNVSHLPLKGLMWGLLSAVSFTTFLLVSGKVANHVPPLRKSMLMSGGGLLLVMTLYPPVDLFSSKFQWSFIFLGLLLGLFGAIFPPLLFSLSMPVVGSGLGTILSASELPTTTILSAFVVSERITFLQMVGNAVILLGIFWANLPQLRYQLLAYQKSRERLKEKGG